MIQLPDDEALVGRVSIQVVRDAWRAVSQELELGHLGILAGERLPAGALGVLDLCTGKSCSMADAAQQLSQHAGVISGEGRFVALTDRRQATIRLEARMPVAELAEFSMATVLTRGRLFSGLPLNPKCVRFRHRPQEPISEYERVFRAPVQFEADRNEIVLDRDDFEAPFPEADPALLAVARAYASQRSVERTMPGSITGAKHNFIRKVEYHLVHAIFSNKTAARQVAERLGMSERGLQRHLRYAGLSYRDLLQSIRCEIAEDYQQFPDAQKKLIFSTLGYSSASAFHRAWSRGKKRREAVEAIT